MNEIILNERAWVEAMLQQPSFGKKPVETLSRIARYYNEEGYKKSEISGLLENYILRCDPSSSIVKWQGAIDVCAKHSDRRGMISIDGVSITKGEIESIRKLNGIMLQMLMFTLLCVAKYGNAVNKDNNGWVNRDTKEIFGMANVTITTKRQSLLINDLWSAGYIGYSRVVDNININVKCIDDEGEQEMFITDFRNLGFQYRRHEGDKYMECCNCGLVIKKTSNRQKYCKDCATDINRQKSIDRYISSTVA